MHGTVNIKFTSHEVTNVSVHTIYRQHFLILLLKLVATEMSLNESQKYNQKSPQCHTSVCYASKITELERFTCFRKFEIEKLCSKQTTCKYHNSVCFADSARPLPL